MATNRDKQIFQVEVQDRNAKKVLRDIGAEGLRTASSINKIAERGKELSKVGFSRLKNGIIGLRKEFADTQKGFTLLRGTLSSLAGNVAAGAVFGLQDLGAQLVRTGIEARRAETRFLAFQDSLEQGRDLYNNYLEIANRLGVAFAPLLDLGTQFRAVGFDAAEAADLIERLTIAAGGSAVAVDSIGRSLRQMKAGKVELEELNPIAEAGVPIFELLRKQIGATNEELFTLVEKRKVSFESVIEAFRRYTQEGGKARTAAEETSGTISANIARLQNEFEQFGKDFVVIFEDDINKPLQDAIKFVQTLTRLFKGSGFFGGTTTSLQEQINQQFGIGPGGFNFGDPTGQFGTRGRDLESARAGQIGIYNEIIAKEKELADLQNSFFAVFRNVRIPLLKSQLGLLRNTFQAQQQYIYLLEQELTTAEEIGEVEKSEADLALERELLLERRLKEIRENRLKINSESKVFVEEILDNYHQQEVVGRRIVTVSDDWITNLRKVNSILSEGNNLFSKNIEIGANIINEQGELSTIEEERLKEIKKINEEYETGFITQEEKLQRIKALNEDAIIDNGLILNKIEDYIKLLQDSDLKNLLVANFREAREHQEALLRAARQKVDIEYSSSTIERLERELLLRSDIVSRLQHQLALEQSLQNYTAEKDFAEKFRTESKTDSEGFGDEAPRSDLQRALDSGALEDIVKILGTIRSGFSSIGRIISSGLNRQLTAARTNLQKIRDQLRVQRLQARENYEEAIDEINNQTEIQVHAAAHRLEANKNAFNEDYRNGLITAQQLTDAKREEDRQYQKTVEELRAKNKSEREREERQRGQGIERLRRLEIKAENDIRQHYYKLQLQMFHFDKGIKIAETFSDGIAGLLKAAADGEWGHFAALLGAGVLQGISLAFGNPPSLPPRIPSYADGGYVSEPTVLVAGDGKKGEYLVPEEKVDAALGMNNDNIVVNINGIMIGDEDLPENLIKKIVSGIKEAKRNRVI